MKKTKNTRLIGNGIAAILLTAMCCTNAVTLRAQVYADTIRITDAGGGSIIFDLRNPYPVLVEATAEKAVYTLATDHLYSIYSSEGRLIEQKEGKRIDLSHLGAGTYHLVFGKGKGRRFVVTVMP